MSIVNSLIELHHGKIQVESQPGLGSRFTLTIPISSAAYREEEISGNINQTIEWPDFIPDDSVPFSIPKPKIEVPSLDLDSLPMVLIVEDNEDMLWFISSLLQPCFQVSMAEHAEKALEFIQRNEPDLILSDIMMPGKGGFGLVKELKSSPKYSHIPIILITALSGRDKELEALAVGADDYITKPFDAAILVQKVSNRIHNRLQFRKRFALADTRVVSDPDIGLVDQQFLDKLLAVLDHESGDSDFSVKELVNLMGMSHSVLFRKAKALTGLNLNELLVMIRLEKAHHILSSENIPIKEVAYRVGFNDPKYFSTRFRKKYGLSPSELLDSNSFS